MGTETRPQPPVTTISNKYLQKKQGIQSMLTCDKKNENTDYANVTYIYCHKFIISIMLRECSYRCCKHVTHTHAFTLSIQVSLQASHRL